MRVGLGGIWHESNSFVPTPTTLEDFRLFQLFVGTGILEGMAGTRSELGGALDACRDLGIDGVPLLFAGALPSGPVSAPVFAELLSGLVERTRAAGGLDGVVLALHGAMVVEGRADPEADIVRAIRAVVGQAPIAVTLDYHANVSPDLAAAADYLVGYRSYPHEDMPERGAEAVSLVARHVRDRRVVSRALVKVPLLTLPVTQESHVQPMAGILAAADALRGEASVSAVSAVPGFAYGDGSRLGFSVYVAADGDAAPLARELATLVWSSRDDFAMPLLDADAAVAEAMRSEGVSVLVDVADNVGGGSPGDSTEILHAMERQGAQGTAVVVWDPEAVAHLHEGSYIDGQHLQVSIGGRSSPDMGPPFAAEGVLRRHGRVLYPRSSSYMTGQVVDMGRVAVIEARTGPLIVTENRIVPFDEDHLRVVGIDPSEQRAIVVKAAIAWKAAFGAIASRVLFVSGPGACPVRLDSLAYSSRQNPLYPLDQLATWEAL